MCGERRNPNATLTCSWKIPEFISNTLYFLGNMKIDGYNTDFFPGAISVQ